MECYQRNLTIRQNYVNNCYNDYNTNYGAAFIDSTQNMTFDDLKIANP